MAADKYDHDANMAKLREQRDILRNITETREKVIKHIRENGFVQGIFKHDIRTFCKDAGYIVYRDGAKFVISKEYLPFEGKTEDIFLIEKVPKSVINAYLTRGIYIQQYKVPSHGFSHRERCERCLFVDNHRKCFKYHVVMTKLEKE